MSALGAAGVSQADGTLYNLQLTKHSVWLNN